MLKKLVRLGTKFGRRRLAIDEELTKPRGLYANKELDHKRVRKLILSGHLAPCYVGSDDPSSDLEECPICFLYYPSLNRSTCCAKGMCTECFLQMKAPHTMRPTQCPFCKTPSYCVEYKGAKTLEEKGREQAEEQKVIEAKIRMQKEEKEEDEKRWRKREQDILEGRIPLPPPPPPPAAGEPLPELPVSWMNDASLGSWMVGGDTLQGQEQRQQHRAGSSDGGTGGGGEVREARSQAVSAPAEQGSRTGGSLRSLSGSSSSGWSVFGTVGRPPLLWESSRSRGGGLFRSETVRAIEADSLWFRSGSPLESTSTSTRRTTNSYSFPIPSTPVFLRSPGPSSSPPPSNPTNTVATTTSTTSSTTTTTTAAVSIGMAEGSASAFTPTPLYHTRSALMNSRWEEPEFDMELEDIMMDEAIWQSLRLAQEQGAHGGSGGLTDVTSTSTSEGVMGGSFALETQMLAHLWPTGGMSSSAAALAMAERQAAALSRQSASASGSSDVMMHTTASTSSGSSSSTNNRNNNSNNTAGAHHTFVSTGGGTDDDIEEAFLRSMVVLPPPSPPSPRMTTTTTTTTTTTAPPAVPELTHVVLSSVPVAEGGAAMACADTSSCSSSSSSALVSVATQTQLAVAPQEEEVPPHASCSLVPPPPPPPTPLVMTMMMQPAPSPSILSSGPSPEHTCLSQGTSEPPILTERRRPSLPDDDTFEIPLTPHADDAGFLLSASGGHSAAMSASVQQQDIEMAVAREAATYGKSGASSEESALPRAAVAIGRDQAALVSSLSSVPETFEDQILYAIALSLQESEARGGM